MDRRTDEQNYGRTDGRTDGHIEGLADRAPVDIMSYLEVEEEKRGVGGRKGKRFYWAKHSAACRERNTGGVGRPFAQSPFIRHRLDEEAA